MKDQRHGTGRMTLPDGTVHEGEWQDDGLHGVGKCESGVRLWKRLLLPCLVEHAAAPAGSCSLGQHAVTP